MDNITLQRVSSPCALFRRSALWLALPGIVALIGSGCRPTTSNDFHLQEKSPVLLITEAKAEVPLPQVKKTPTPKAKKWSATPIPKWAQGEIVHHVKTKPGDKVFALTFDDGPWPRETHRILKILRKYNAKATFFMIGQEVMHYPEIARAIRDEGHAIGNHSWNHPSRCRDPKAQIVRTNQEIKKALGFEPNLFRPPYGMLKNGLAREAMKKNMSVIIWSSDSNDWKHPGSSSIARTVLRQASSGGIGLLHDGGGNRAQTIAALPVILETLQARGYRFVTVPELLAMRYVAPQKKKTPQKTSSSSSSRPKSAPPVGTPRATPTQKASSMPKTMPTSKATPQGY